ncbi:MAG: hypothetical protein JNK82_40505 [Myxococcaceae bacterium]|nr:hypothetical protein [Myxococcaceae bacterium]
MPVALTAAFVAGLLLTTGGVRLAVGGAAAVILPLLWVKSVRAAVSRRHVLVRSAGRLLLDGEPIEAARIELRVLRHWLLRRPQRYALSLWALIGRGEQVDVDLGSYPSMLEASLLSGQMEDFLERAKARAPGRAPTVD